MNRLAHLLAALALALATLAFSAPHASADPYHSAGCRTASFTEHWGFVNAGPGIAYGTTNTMRWCWTAGSMTQEKVYNVTGHNYCYANTIFKVQKCLGPTDAYKYPISAGTRYSGGTAYAYFWLQSEDCVPGTPVCSGWSWHKMKYALEAGGNHYRLIGPGA